MLKIMFVPKKEEVRGGQRQLHNEKLHNLYSSPITVWVIKLMMRWAELTADTAQMRNMHNIIRKCKGKRPLSRPRHIWRKILKRY
jgi:hypothetical protein